MQHCKSSPDQQDDSAARMSADSAAAGDVGLVQDAGAAHAVKQPRPSDTSVAVQPGTSPRTP